MTRVGVLVAGVLPMLAATAVSAQAQAPQVEETVRAPEVLPYRAERPTPPAVFWIGGLPVRIWAPVPAPYNALANRNGAANPLPR